MGIEVRLKTGFFKTTLYRLEVKNKRLCFFSPGSEKSPQFEIETESFSYRGLFLSNDDWTQALELIKSELSVKIFCKFEGGSHETGKLFKKTPCCPADSGNDCRNDFPGCGS
ncbi:MAG: hypothetical protein PHF24_06845 [Syntrophomonas sp.]|nr:hypothetical protein [Syntrophomonas sp.]